MRKFTSLNAKTAAYNGLLHIKQVKVKADRVCSICGKTISKNSIALTACRLIDLKYNKTYRYVIDNNLNVQKFHFVKQRYWMHDTCSNTIKIKQPKTVSVNIDSKEFENLSYEQQLDLLYKMYKNKEISIEEYQDIEESLIDAIAFRDALVNEF